MLATATFSAATAPTATEYISRAEYDAVVDLAAIMWATVPTARTLLLCDLSGDPGLARRGRLRLPVLPVDLTVREATPPHFAAVAGLLRAILPDAEAGHACYPSEPA